MELSAVSGQVLKRFLDILPYAFACSLFLGYTVVLNYMKWSINWNSRMLSATCVDPDSDAWGSVDYQETINGHTGVWVDCGGGGDGTCTPWGYECQGNDYDSLEDK